MTEPLTLPFLFPDIEAQFRADRVHPIASASVDALMHDEPVVGYYLEGGPSGPFDLLDPAQHPGLRARGIATMERVAQAPFSLDVGNGIPFACLATQTFAASSIICPSDMERLREFLGSPPGLWVGVPRQNTLYAVPDTSGHKGWHALITMVASVFSNDDKNELFDSVSPVSYSLWHVVDGHVVRPVDEPEKKRRFFRR